jgi:hypothetical protein
VVFAILGGTAPARAQTPDSLLAQARAAFDNLDFEQAARLYTRVLELGVGATRPQRDTAQLYLGASFEFAGQRVNALAAFRTFIRASPCAPTPQVFGGNVVTAFIEARLQVFAAAVCTLREQRLAAGDSLTLRVVATRPAVVEVALQDGAGRVLGTLGQAPLEEGFAEVRLGPVPDPATFGPEPARYTLLLRAREREGAESDQRLVPVTLRAPPPDTLAHPLPPADSLFRPEVRTTGAAADLGKTLLVAVAAVAIPTTVGHRSLRGDTPKAAVVAGAISLTGVVAFARGQARRDIPENRAYNEELRQRWQRELDEARAENRRRLDARRLVIAPASEAR